MTYPLLSLYPRSGYIMCLLRTCEWLFRITFGTFFGTYSILTTDIDRRNEFL